MATPLDTYLRAEFPKEYVTNESYESVFEYIGPTDEVSGIAVLGGEWGDTPGVIEDVRREPVARGGEQTPYSILIVRVVKKFSPGEAGAAVELETNHELDWMAVQKPLIDHPVFGETGAWSLVPAEKSIYIPKWEEMPVAAFKENFKYYPGRYEDWDGGEDSLNTLTQNAKYYAQGRLLGLEYYTEFAPVVRKLTTYKNGLPEGSGAGEKEDPDFGDNDLPAGYEWIKNTDSSIETAKQNEWKRTQEWLGANKVLVDSKNTYWDPPA